LKHRTSALMTVGMDLVLFDVMNRIRGTRVTGFLVSIPQWTNFSFLQTHFCYNALYEQKLMDHPGVTTNLTM